MGLFDRFKKNNASKPVVKVADDSPEGSLMNRLSQLQTRMISLCNDYARGRADRIYIHGYLGGSVFSAKDLYEVNGKLVRSHKLGEVIKLKTDEESPMRALTHGFVEIDQVLREANQKVPFEIKMIYDARKGSLNGKWNYPPLPKGVKEDVAPQALSELWFEELGVESSAMLDLMRKSGDLGPAGPNTSTPSPQHAGDGENRTKKNTENEAVAHRGDWKTQSMPQQHDTFVLHRAFSEAEMAALRHGNVPQAMEDKWFWYMEDSTLWAHRSWTGHCIYQIEFKEDDNHLVTVNRDPEQYGCTSIEEDIELLNRLLDWWTQSPYDHYNEWLSEVSEAVKKTQG